MGVERLDSISNEEGLARIISDYEKYKNPQSANIKLGWKASPMEEVNILHFIILISGGVWEQT